MLHPIWKFILIILHFSRFSINEIENLCYNAQYHKDIPISSIVHYRQKGGRICIMPIPPIRRENLNLSKNI